MQIGCTQKLLDYLGCDTQNHDSSAPAFFNFTANLITVARRKCIAVIHNESRCGFVLYGITAKEKKDIRSLILQGIGAMLKKERYCREIIDRFVSDCKDISFTKTAGRVYVSRINKFCETVSFFSEYFRKDSVLQEHILPKVNDDFRKFGDDYEHTYKMLDKLVEEHYQRPPHLYRAAVLDIDLQLENTVCNRRITVPFDISLFQLHVMIQSVFEWENYHNHGFVLKLAPNGNILEYASLFPEEYSDFLPPHTRIHNELDLLLSDVFPEKKSIIYEYDFGDNWIHKISFVKEIKDCTLPSPICENADDLAPPEDCGGPGGFEDLKRILKDPKDEEYRDMVDWYGRTEIHNKNIVHINSLLREAIRVFPEDWGEEYDG